MGQITIFLKNFSFFVFLGASSSLMAFQENELIIIEDSVIDITCPGTPTGSISVTVSGGTGEISYSWTGPGGYASPDEDISGLAAGTYFLTATDQTSPTPLTASAQFTIQEEDSESPVVQTKNITVQLGLNGTALITVEDIDDGSSDNCEIDRISVDKTNFDCSNVGANIVTLTVTDTNGNSSSKEATVTVEDNEIPAVATQNITIQLGLNGTALITAEDIDNGSSDNCEIDRISVDKTNFDCSNVGANIVTLTVTDTNGNSSSKEATVTVEDNEIPAVATQNVTIQLGPNGTASITAEDIDNGSSDNCGIAKYDLSQTNFDCSNLGANQVNLTITDNNGNSAEKIATVTVEDNIAPIVLTQDIIVHLDANGNASIAPSDIDNGSSDNCGTLDYSLSQTNFDCSDIGSQTVTLTVTDASNNSSSATATVTIEDNIAPEAIAQNITIQLSPDGTASITPDDINNGSSDNCGTLNYSLSQTSFDCSDIGSQTVTLTVTDTSNNSSSATATVTIEDSIAPEAIAQNITIQLSPNGTASITPDDINNGSSDNCGTLNYRLSQTSFDCSDVGENTVILTVTDNNGNTASDTAIVILEDETVPTVVTKNIIVRLDAAGNAIIAEDAVNDGSSDPCGELAFDTNITHFDCSNIGDNTVILSVIDNYDNTASESATVTVVDEAAPIVQVQNITIELDSSGAATIAAEDVDNGSSDNCGVASFELSKTIFNCSNVGPNNVVLTVTDVNGNKSTKTAVVTVQDKVVPVISATTDITRNSDEGTCSAAINMDVPTVSDNCSVSPPTGTRDDGKALTAAYPVGTTIITWNAKDANGNKATPVQQTVTVEDKEAPVAPVLEDIIWGCEYSITAPTTTDNCSDSIAVTANRSLTFSDPGTHTITWTFTDESNNATSVDQKVTIDPVEAQADIMDISCNGFSTGEAAITGSGGIGPYTYTWTTLGSGPTKTNLSAGTYEVVVTDVNGCATEPLQVIISEPDTFVEITGITFTSGCFEQNNGTATVKAKGGTGEYRYLWDDGQTTPTATGLEPGQHSVTVTDENGCETTRSVTITTPEELIMPTVSTTHTTSFGSATGTATANVTGGTGPYSFRWSTGQTGQIARDLPSGDYDVTVTDANNCTYTKGFTIYDPLEATIVPASLCLTEEGGIRTSKFETENVRGGSGSYTYEWNFGIDAAPATAEGAGPHVVVYSSTGDKIITLTVTDTNGMAITKTLTQYVGECFETCGNTSNFDIELDSFYIGKEDGTPLTTADCNFTGKKYIFLKSVSNANAYSPMVEYIYTLTMDGNTTSHKVVACLAEYDEKSRRYLKIPELINLGEVADWSCGYRIEMENFFMSWTNNFKRGCGENPKMMCLSTNEDDEIIYPLYLSAVKRDLLCYNVPTGTITATASGGRGAYQYSIDGVNWQSSHIFDNLEAGSYTVTVRDGEGDTAQSQTLEIAEPSDPLTIEKPVTMAPVTCYGGSDGSATVNVSGGTPFETGDPYIYVWSNNQTTATATGLAAGEYEITIIDANGCEITEVIVIEQPDQIPANAGTDLLLPCGVSVTTIGTEIPEGETGRWQFINGPAGWEIEDPNSATTTFSGSIGTYTLRWTESCGSTDDLKITVRDCSTIDFDGEDDHIEFGDNYDLSGDFSIEAWVKLKSTSGIKTVASKRDVTNYSSGGYDLVIENGTPKFRWDDQNIVSEFPVGTNRWYHLAVTSNSSETQLYIDGIKVAGGASASPIKNDDPFLIGAMFNSNKPLAPENYFHGWIEEVRIWNTAISQKQLRFMMNQRLANNDGTVKGEEIPLNVPGELSWNSLAGYYHMNMVQGGYTSGVEGTPSARGKLRNITTAQQRSAPLPYISKRNGDWRDTTTISTPWLFGEGIWDSPNSLGVNNDSLINWNIVRTSHDISSGNKDITLLGLISEKDKLSVFDPNEVKNEYNPGHSLQITHYLKLDGIIDLVGESQLLQDEGSILEESSLGNIERDQQGTASSYNYNYWSSPVSPTGGANNAPYTIAGVMRDGTNPANPIPLVFNYQYEFADWRYSGAKRISSYWLHVYTNSKSNTYSEWQHVGEKGYIKAGEGFSMKGTLGSAKISDRQNYVFTGKPNNGTIALTVGAGNDYLIGNPYPSAIDGYKFIRDNITVSGGTNTKNVFNGTLYFWDHFSGKTHYLQEYVGGYAALNLSGGIEAVATDERINATGEKAPIKPEKFIPVGQAFYISTQLAPELEDLTTVSGGDILFKNSQRHFETDDQAGDNSVFKSREGSNQGQKTAADERQKIYLMFSSPGGYHRQILVTSDPHTSTGFDLGYDAPLIEDNKEDMYWMINDVEFVIQGVPDFNQERILPLGIKIQKEGNFSIAIDKTPNIPDHFNIYLKDSLSGAIHDLRTSSFKASAITGNINNRFSIIFQKDNPKDEEGTEENENEEDDGGEEGDGNADGNDGEDNTEKNISRGLEVFYSIHDSGIIIKNPEKLSIQKGTLYNALGQKIIEYRNVPVETLVKLPVRLNSSGVYIFNLQSQAGNKSVRFIVD